MGQPFFCVDRDTRVQTETLVCERRVLRVPDGIAVDIIQVWAQAQLQRYRALLFSLVDFKVKATYTTQA